MVSATGWADTLTQLLARQQAIYLQMQAFSRRQTQLIESGDAESLLALLDERQKLIDQLIAISREVEPFKQRWPALWASLDDTARTQLKTHIDAVQEMLDQILQQDERDRAALVEHRQKIGAQLTGLKRSSAAHQAYRPSSSATVTSRFTDRQG